MDEVNLNFRSMGQLKEWILIEIGFLHAPVLDGKFQTQHGAEAIDHRPLALILGAAEIDNRTHIGSYRDFMHGQLFARPDSHLGNLGEMAGVTEVEG